MPDIAIWICFAFCLLLTLKGVLTIFGKIQFKNSTSFSYFLYYAILVYTYGYYSLWSGVFLDYFQIDTNTAFLSKIINVMGAPFLIIGLMMFLFWINGIFNLKIKNYRVGIFYLIVFTSIQLLPFVKNSFIVSFQDGYNISAFVISLFAGVFLLIKNTPLLSVKIRLFLSFLFVLLASYFLMEIFVVRNETWVQPALNTFFFLTQSSIVIVFIFNADFMINGVESDMIISLNDFIEMHKISKRESEIIAEVMHGKTNLQIAESLFITEQTVKDHMSRIFQKTHLRSRSQLISTIKN